MSFDNDRREERGSEIGLVYTYRQITMGIKTTDCTDFKQME
jgi:hypothetical protein